MHKTSLAFCRYFLFGAAAILVLLLMSRFVRMMNWPWWVGGFLLLILLGLCAGAIMVRKLIIRRREQHFVLQVTRRDDEQLKKPASQEQSHLMDLQNRWKEALEALRRSDLKKRGDPLYVLPWFLVMGESGSGKTTAINSAQLSSPFAELHGRDQLSGTRNCDWWPLDQAILIDTAGRYAMPTDPKADDEEWQKFLSLLVKYRKREPIQGLVVTVAADKLVSGSMQELENDARQLRSRIDQLMRALGIKFPVYVLVTKLDLLHGMVQFSGQLPLKCLDQPMGVMNEEMTDVQGFLERFSVSVAKRLKNLRILLLHRPEPGPVPAGLLLFPEQMQLLKPGLETFMRRAFQENSYQDTPLLRGIYLGSGRQQKTEGADSPGQRGKASESRGMFLHDFFEKILPGDRGVVTPAARTVQWNMLTRNIGLTSWVLIGIALCGLLSYSFVKNMAVIRESSAVMTKVPELNGGTADLASLDRFRMMIVKVEKQNLNWWLPRFGLNQSRQAESALKARYCRLFQDRFLASFDQDMTAAVAGFSASTRDEVSGRYLIHLSRRINLLKAALEGAGLAGLHSKPLPSYLKSALLEGADAESSRRFGDMYLAYLLWRPDRSEVNQEVQLLQDLLKQAVAVKGITLAWLIDLANKEEPDAGLTLGSFWGGSRMLPAEPVIAPAFTGKGKSQVTALLNELCAAYPGTGVLEREKAHLEAAYRDSFFAAWQRFAVLFPKGEGRLVGAGEWRKTAAVMSSEQGPYAAFIRRAVVELEPFGTAENLPPWLAQLYQYQALKTAGPSAGVVALAAERGKRIAQTLGNVAGKDLGAVAGITPANLVQEYLVALEQLAPVAVSRGLAHQMAQQAFNEDPAVSKSPLYQAAGAAQRLTGVLSQGGSDPSFSRLVSGPVAFYGSFVRMETACSLQKQWEEKVLKEVQGVSDPQTLQYLLERDGPVWKFLSDSADPFIGWSPGRGYYSKSALGGSVPFSPGFYSFLAKGAKAKTAVAAAGRQSYTLTFKGLPTDANSEARIKPQSTRLELLCATGPQVIDNMNYPVSKTFVWSPDSCSDVIFQVDMGEVILTKRYPGPRGLPDFLKDFPGGRRTFLPQQFPAQKQALERMGISYIRANYQFSGGHGIPSGKSKSLPGQVPLKITECWD